MVFTISKSDLKVEQIKDCVVVARRANISGKIRMQLRVLMRMVVKGD